MKLFLNYKTRIAQLFLFLCTICSAQAQFSYSLSLDSSAQYTSLSSATLLSPGEKWLPAYEIPTGFGSGAAQTVTIETNGFVVYNRQFNSAVMAFNGFQCKQDTVAAWSRLSYKKEGAAGSKILKIEFMGVGQGSDPKELLSYQVWLHESGAFDIFVGPNSYAPAPGDTLTDTSRVVYIGLINRNMDGASNGVLLSGTPQVPAPLALSGENPALAYLRTVPKRNYKYTFTPTQN